MPPFPPSDGQGGVSASQPPPSSSPFQPTSSPLQPPPDNGRLLGIISLIVGIASLPISGCCAIICLPIGLFGMLGGVIGAIFGVLGMRQASRVDEKNPLALWGLIISIVGIVLSLGWFLLSGLAIAMNGL